MNHLPQSIVTGVLVFNDQQGVLLCLKPKGVGPYPDMYLTPGGHIDAGETAIAGAEREVREETGVSITHLVPLLFDEFVTPNWKGEETHFIALLYTAKYASGGLKASAKDDDHMREIRWFNKKDLKALPLSPPLKRALKKLDFLS
ncbi:MAG: NUDIX hydrolase [Patescibacteria group bacterium]